MYKMLSLTHCKKILQSFLRLLPQLFLFELAFKVLSLFLFIPAGKELIVMMLEIAGDTSLYNYHMLQILFSFPGIAAIVLILCLSAFLAYFEFSFIFIALYQSYAGSSFSLKDTLKTSVYSLFSLNFRDIPGFFVYGILLLPFQNLYLVPSVMPRLEIPNFVTGELSKRWYGNFVLDLGYTLIFLLFLLLLFLLPGMILKGKSFREGCKESIFTWKKAGLKGILLLGILMAVAVLQATGILGSMADWLDEKVHNIYIINVLLGCISSIIDNVPLVAAAMGMYEIVPFDQVPDLLAASDIYRLNFVQDGGFWLLLSYCAGVGGSMLIIGSAAGVVVMGLEKMNFGWYLKHISWLALLGYLAGAAILIAELIMFPPIHTFHGF